MTPFLVTILLIAGSSVGMPPTGIASMHSLIGRPAGAPALDRTAGAVARDTVRAGETFIANLPDSLGGRAVISYRGVALPAFSMLIEKSFFWRTQETDRGEHEFWFRATLASGDDSLGATADSLSERADSLSERADSLAARDSLAAGGDTLSLALDSVSVRVTVE